MSGEIEPMSGGKMQMHVQRHDAHEQGHLTPEGHEHAKQIATEKVRTYLDENPETHFMVVSSDQVFDDMEPELGGIRAKETADDIVSVIRGSLADRGLPEDHLFGTTEEPVTSSPNLREANIFSNKFMQHLRAQYPDENAWSLYYQDADADTREKMTAESPRDLAMRMDYMVKTAETVGASLHKVPGKEESPLVVWMVGHGGGLDAYLHHYANVPIDQLGFDLSGGFTLRASPNNGVVAEVKGVVYPVKSDDTLSLPQ